MQRKTTNVVSMKVEVKKELQTGSQSPKQYGILSLLEHVDRGFDIESDLLVGVTLNIPPF